MHRSELFTKSGNLKAHPADSLFSDAHVSDMEYFIKNLSVIKGKEVRPDLIGSIITHYASKWIPELGGDEEAAGIAIASLEESPESVTASWTKKRFFIESLVGILPIEKDSIPCNFLLRLLRVANMVQVEPAFCSELERRISLLLDQASLKELMIPSFSHTTTTLLDVKLILRLMKRFVNTEEVAKSGAAVMKVAKLVDSYLAEAAVDSCLTLPEFVELACALPNHARTTDDGLYRAIDTYLKAHPALSKQDRKTLWKLIDSRKLSHDASLHAAQNERLPVRAVIQVLLSEQNKLNKHMDWSGSLNGMRSPGAAGLDLSTRCLSKRETGIQQMEIKRLKEDVLRLQSQCMAMEKKMEKLLEKKRESYFSWRKLGIIAYFRGNKVRENEEGEGGVAEAKAKLTRGKMSTRRRTLS